MITDMKMDTALQNTFKTVLGCIRPANLYQVRNIRSGRLHQDIMGLEHLNDENNQFEMAIWRLGEPGLFHACDLSVRLKTNQFTGGIDIDMRGPHLVSVLYDAAGVHGQFYPNVKDYLMVSTAERLARALNHVIKQVHSDFHEHQLMTATQCFS